METLDDIIRYSAFALHAWLGVLMLRDFCDRAAGRLGAAAAFSSAAFLLASKPGLNVFGIDVDLILLPVYVVSPAMAWLFCLSQFDDNFKVTNMHKWVVLAKLFTGVGAYIAWKNSDTQVAGLLNGASNVIVLGTLVHLEFVAWQGRNDDLVETRRKFRSIFVTAVILITVGIMISDSASALNQVLTIDLLFQAAGFLAIALFLHWRLSAQGGEDLFFTTPVPALEKGNHDHCELSPTDQHDLDVIVGVASSGVVLEQGLTIAKMAQDTGIPEHKLRHLINQHLGFRNFADFLNHHRIEMAKNRLAARENRHTPVLTVAMDLGYGSLGPFNRAFKERTGQTPTEFRSQSMMAMGASAK